MSLKHAFKAQMPRNRCKNKSKDNSRQTAQLQKPSLKPTSSPSYSRYDIRCKPPEKRYKPSEGEAKPYRAPIRPALKHTWTRCTAPNHPASSQRISADISSTANQRGHMLRRTQKYELSQGKKRSACYFSSNIIVYTALLSLLVTAKNTRYP